MTYQHLYKLANQFQKIAAMGKDQAREILRVPENASIDDINKSYRYLVHKYHPDRNPGKSSETDPILMAIIQARNILINPEKNELRTRVDRAKNISLDEKSLQSFEDLLNELKVK